MAGDMAAAAEAAHGGVVAVAGRHFPVVPLPAAGEQALARDMRALAARRDGPGGVFARFTGVLEWAAGQNPRLYLALVSELTGRHKAAPDGDPDVAGAEDSPEGVALELWHRARPAKPDLTLADCEAVVTAANAADVRRRVEEAVTAQGKSAAAG